MSSFSRLAQVGYVIGLGTLLSLMLWPTGSQGQFGISTGFRSTPALPTIAIPVFSGSGSGAGSGGGASGFSGASGAFSGSFSTQIVTINLGDFFPNHGQIVGMPPPTLMPILNNFQFGPFLSDSTGAPWAQLLGFNLGGGVGITGGGIGGVGFGGAGGGIAGVGGGIGGGGMGGFAGKGFGGFNGKKPY